MNKWISVKDRLPFLWEIVWIYWRDREVVLGYKIDDKCEPEWGWFSFEHEKCKYSHWWMSNQNAFGEKPEPPDYIPDPLPSSAITFKRYDSLKIYGKEIQIKSI